MGMGKSNHLDGLNRYSEEVREERDSEDTKVTSTGIAEAFDFVDRQLNELEDRISDLLERIEPVLGPTLPSNETSADAMPENLQSPVAGSIRLNGRRARGIAETVQRALERLEL